MTEHDANLGAALALFAAASNWKAYLCGQTRPYVTGRVLEVGAGIGATMLALCDGTQTSWTALEPDPESAAQIGRPAAMPGEVALDVRVGTTESLAGSGPFDSIIYVDVLEHIEDDAAEMRRAAELLAPGGALVVLSPAHRVLFSPFDSAIGHLRRYTMRSLSELTPPGLRLEKHRYLDSAGILASFASRLFIRSPLPSRGQILFWDRVLVPISRCLDPLLGYRVGKSILVVWRRP